LDEFRVWDYELSSENILSRFNNELIGNIAGLICCYNMNDIFDSGFDLDAANRAEDLGMDLDGITLASKILLLFISF